MVPSRNIRYLQDPSQCVNAGESVGALLSLDLDAVWTVVRQRLRSIDGRNFSDLAQSPKTSNRLVSY